ncbi:MAG: twin-arginine translocase subunit TatC [Candidatus Omnitrophica bacterium]|nr:twin-arginine translocase subunit TatC [Candidatus Omnitrophota bacterium]
MDNDKKLTLVEHLGELRGRLIKSVAAVIIFSGILYSSSGKILNILSRPVGKLVFISPVELFLVYIKVALFGGFFLASPVIIYQIWRFVSAGLKPSENKAIIIFGPASFLLFLLGASFAYFVIMPVGIHFLLGFATDAIKPMITVNNYISFISMITIAFGAIFELPIVVLFLTKIGLVTPTLLYSKRRHIILSIFILSAMLTPPDVVTQILMAIPLLVLFEVSVLLSRFVYRKKFSA